MITDQLLAVLPPILFGIGLCIVLVKKSLLFKLIGLELMLNAGMINLVFWNQNVNSSLNGQVFTLLVMAIAASEIALALAIIVQLSKVK